MMAQGRSDHAIDLKSLTLDRAYSRIEVQVLWKATIMGY